MQGKRMVRNIGVIANTAAKSKFYLELLAKKCNVLSSQEIRQNSIDLIVVIGGDGMMLHAIHDFMDLKVPFYGIKTGNLGFLMNEIIDPSPENLFEYLTTGHKISIRPLAMNAIDNEGQKHKALAINEVSLLRQTHQAAITDVYVNNKLQLEHLTSDGILVATPAGSTAYNLSAGGPILPINSNLLAITPISPFRPRRWHGALVELESKIDIEVVDPIKRPMSATADFNEIRNIKSVSIGIIREQIMLLFNHTQKFEDKTLKEQFTVG
jgi:NAD+ kinase